MNTNNPNTTYDENYIDDDMNCNIVNTSGIFEKTEFGTKQTTLVEIGLD